MNQTSSWREKQQYTAVNNADRDKTLMRHHRYTTLKKELNKQHPATNIDEVLICHCDFQDKCLEECMLTSPSLLKTITQLLEICREYCTFIQETINDVIGDCFLLKINDPNILAGPDEIRSYGECIDQLDTRFTVTLIDLLDQINEMGRDSNKDRLFNLLYRLDYSYYTAKMERILAHQINSETSG